MVVNGLYLTIATVILFNSSSIRSVVSAPREDNGRSRLVLLTQRAANDLARPPLGAAAPRPASS